MVIEKTRIHVPEVVGHKRSQGGVLLPIAEKEPPGFITPNQKELHQAIAHFAKSNAENRSE